MTGVPNAVARDSQFLNSSGKTHSEEVHRRFRLRHQTNQLNQQDSDLMKDDSRSGGEDTSRLL